MKVIAVLIFTLMSTSGHAAFFINCGEETNDYWLQEMLNGWYEDTLQAGLPAENREKARELAREILTSPKGFEAFQIRKQELIAVDGAELIEIVVSNKNHLRVCAIFKGEEKLY